MAFMRKNYNKHKCSSEQTSKPAAGIWMKTVQEF